MITIEEYSSFFLSIILGLGISFEMPILIFFLALFGIVSPQFLWKNIRYAILAVFLVAAIITPSPDPWTMCIYAIPMLGLYLIGIGVAWWVHPSRRKAKEVTLVMFSFWTRAVAGALLLASILAHPLMAQAQQHASSGRTAFQRRQGL